MILGQARRHLGQMFHALARQKECQIIEGHVMPDHVHMCIAIPPKNRAMALNWSKSANTSASRTPRMEQNGQFSFANIGALQRDA